MRENRTDNIQGLVEEKEISDMRHENFFGEQLAQRGRPWQRQLGIRHQTSQ